jgi:predicted enzyme related to lactoylglutathione lyase
MIAPEPSGIGGHMSTLGHEPHHYTIFYVDVADVAATLKQAESLGGKTLVPPVDIPTARSPGCKIPKGIRSDSGKPKPSLLLAVILHSCVRRKRSDS